MAAPMAHAVHAAQAAYETQAVQAVPAAQAAGTPGAEGRAVALSAGSTCWPWLLCLCWHGADGRAGALIAWPGNVADGRFRALALACRAIVMEHKAVA